MILSAKDVTTILIAFCGGAEKDLEEYLITKDQGANMIKVFGANYKPTGAN